MVQSRCASFLLKGGDLTVYKFLGRSLFSLVLVESSNSEGPTWVHEGVRPSSRFLPILQAISATDFSLRDLSALIHFYQSPSEISWRQPRNHLRWRPVYACVFEFYLHVVRASRALPVWRLGCRVGDFAEPGGTAFRFPVPKHGENLLSDLKFSIREGPRPSLEVLKVARGQLDSNLYGASTVESYTKFWDRWISFCHEHGRSQFLICRVSDVVGRQGEDDFLSAFLTHVALTWGSSPSSLNTASAAIKWGHSRVGLPNPTADRPLSDLTKRAISKLTVPEQKRPPVTPQMMRKLSQAFESELAFASPRDAIRLRSTWAAICVGWSCLLRVSEIVHLKADKSAAKGLRVSDLSLQKAENVWVLGVRIRASKVDQRGVGVTMERAQIDKPYCPVTAVAKWFDCLPPHLRGQECFAFVDWKGSPIASGSICTRIRSAASVTGAHNPASYGTHSLRIGGATALAAAGFSLPEVMCEGRWASAAALEYIWQARPELSKVRSAFEQDSIEIGHHLRCAA